MLALLFTIFSLIHLPLGHGVPILSNSPTENRPQLDNPDAMSATEIIDAVNIEVDVAPQLFEGDIDRSSDPDEPSVQKRNAQRARQRLWTARTIPYVISDILVQEKYDDTIREAIQQFEEHTCIKWIPHTDEKNWITFVKKSGCYSSVGMNYWRPGSQDISLGRGCNHKGVIMHEMMHASGFWHEQSRYDRDQYVEILWENIVAGKEHNFNKYNPRQIDYLDAVYDIDSIMHYGKRSFSSNGKDTIRAIDDPSKPLGQRNGFSQTDIAQLNALYDCKSPSGGWSSWTAFGPCDSQCKHYRQRFCASHDINNCPEADSYGVQTQHEDCSKEKCNAPVDGHWGRWSAWSSCSVTCDMGKHTRTRQCTDPAPHNGGKKCVGDDNQVGKCERRRCGLGPYDCEFEADGMCHWTLFAPDLNGPKWYRHTGPTGSSGTGPPNDHTSGSGHYLYFEASSPAKPGKTASVFSQEFPGDSCQILTFWYHMLGTGIGTLEVQINDGTSQTIWEKSGEQGNDWLQASFTIKRDSPYKVYFKGVRGADFKGDIAIDDIAFKECPTLPPTTLPPSTKPPTTLPPSTMPPTTKPPSTKPPTTLPPSTMPPTTKPPSTKPPTTLPPSTMPPTTKPPSTKPPTTLPPSTMPPTTLPPIQPTVLDSCNFDGGTLCDWMNSPDNPQLTDGNSYGWQLHKGATPSQTTGPNGDHSANGQGGFIYLDSSTPHAQSAKGMLISKEFPGGSPMCLHLWYHMYGGTRGKCKKDGIAKFRVFVQKKKRRGGTRRWEQFKKCGNRGNKWQHKMITLNANKRKQPFTLIFEGERGKTGLSDIDIALDDVKVVSGLCPKP